MRIFINLVAYLLFFSAVALEGFPQETSGVGIALRKNGEDLVVNVEAMKAYHINALPTVYVIDQQGKVVDSAHDLDSPPIVNRLVHGK